MSAKPRSPDTLLSFGSLATDFVGDSCDNCLEVPNGDQFDSNQDGYGSVCDADLDNNGYTGLSDYGLFLQTYGSGPGSEQYNPDADFDADGGSSENV